MVTHDTERDRFIVDAWDVSLFQGYRRAEDHRREYDQAKARLDRLVLLQAALDRSDDLDALRLWEGLSDYGPAQRYGKAIGQAQARLSERRRAAVAALERAIAHGDDRRILEIWNDPVLTDLPAVQVHESRARQAQSRVDVATKLEGIVDDPAREVEALKLWEEHGLEASSVGKPLRPRIALLTRRRKTLGQVVQATKLSDDALLVTAWDERLLRDYEPARKYEQAVEQARQRLRSVSALRSALASGNGQLAMTLWDDLGVHTLPGASIYDRDVLTCKLRWLADHVPANLQGTLEKGKVSIP